MAAQDPWPRNGKRRYMAIDNWGNTIHGLEYPRRDLLRSLSRQHASKVYRDNPSTGEPTHVGYVIAARWWTIFEVSEWKGTNR